VVATDAEGRVWRGESFFPKITNAPGILDELDERHGGPPDPWMVYAVQGVGLDFNDLAWLGEGITPWSDLVLLRSASAAAWGTGDEEARVEVQQMIDDAIQRWPEHGELEGLAPGPMTPEERTPWARASLDRARSSTTPSWTAVNIAVSYLIRVDPSAVEASDHDRLAWVAQTFPAHRAWTLAQAMGVSLKARHPRQAAHWLAELQALEPEQREAMQLGHRQMRALRLGVVAIGGAPANDWAERTAKQVGACFDQLPPRAFGGDVWVRALFHDNRVTWQPREESAWSREFTTCIEERRVEAPREGDCALEVVFRWSL